MKLSKEERIHKRESPQLKIFNESMAQQHQQTLEEETHQAETNRSGTQSLDLKVCALTHGRFSCFITSKLMLCVKGPLLPLTHHETFHCIQHPTAIACDYPNCTCSDFLGHFIFAGSTLSPDRIVAYICGTSLDTVWEGY